MEKVEKKIPKMKKATEEKPIKEKAKAKAITMTLEEQPTKKSSHKKKTAKWIITDTTTCTENETIGNIILHLNCSIEDLENYKKKQLKDPLEYNPIIPLEIQTFECPNQFTNNQYETGVHWKPLTAYQPFCTKCNAAPKTETTSEETLLVTTTLSNKEEQLIQQKMRDLKIKYFMNNIEWNKVSACFWCTCEFDNKPFYLPQLETKDKIVVYGSFCSPECAVASLFKESIDDTMKFERYHLMNRLYKPQHGNIRPAPSPYYLLEKYLGNLSIQEYRKLLNLQQHNYIIEVNKPMTRMLPEIHTEGDTVSNISAYKIKRQSEVLRQG